MLGLGTGVDICVVNSISSSSPLNPPHPPSTSGSIHYQLPVTSLTESFSDGRIFLALLNDANPVRCEYKPSPSSAVNKQLAFQSAQVGGVDANK